MAGGAAAGSGAGAGEGAGAGGRGRLQPLVSYGAEIGPRLGLASFAVATVTVERMSWQVVSTSHEPRLPEMTLARSLAIYRRSAAKQTAVVAGQYTGMREIKLGLDAVQPWPALSTLVATGTTGVVGSSLQYNCAIQDTYASYGYNPPIRLTLVDFYRQKVAPGLVWSFLRAGLCTGSALYVNPATTARLDALARGRAGVESPGWLTKLATGLLTGSVFSLATQWIHNVALVAGRMAALGETAQAPYYTSISLRAAIREFGFSILYLNFGQRMAINAVAVAVLNYCDVFGRPELSPWGG